MAIECLPVCNSNKIEISQNNINKTRTKCYLKVEINASILKENKYFIFLIN